MHICSVIPVSKKIRHIIVNNLFFIISSFICVITKDEFYVNLFSQSKMFNFKCNFLLLQ